MIMVFHRSYCSAAMSFSVLDDTLVVFNGFVGFNGQVLTYGVGRRSIRMNETVNMVILLVLQNV